MADAAWLEERLTSDDEETEATWALLATMHQQLGIGLQMEVPVRRGSQQGRAPNIERGFAAAHERIWKDYFAPNSVYPRETFRRRFRMRRKLFVKIHNAVVNHDVYFQEKCDAIGRRGLSSLQKITAVMRIFEYGMASDAVDENIRIGESTMTKCFYNFAAAVNELFGDEYLREPSPTDVLRHMQINELRGFPGMFGLLDCTHWEGKNYPVGWQGMYQDKDGTRSLVMEAIATKDLWIWHAFIGLPGSLNDINVVDRSPLMVNYLRGVAPHAEFRVIGLPYHMCYLLADGIYPDWSMFQKTISEPQGEKRKWYAARQEGARKDVEHAFGVLQARWGVVQYSCLVWSEAIMKMVWKGAVIMHNMVVDDEECNPDLNSDFRIQQTAARLEQYRVPIPLFFKRYMPGS